MGVFDRVRKAFAGTSKPAQNAANAQPILEAVTQVMICASWDELLCVFTKYSTELRAPDVEGIVDALRHSFEDDAYTLALIAERANILALHKKHGIQAVLKHPSVSLKEPTSSLRFFAKIGSLKSADEAQAAAKELKRISGQR
jgi:hypothetical protein